MLSPLFFSFLVIFINYENKMINMKKIGKKAQVWLTPILGMPFILLAILIIFGLVFFFGVAFLFKNIIWLAIVIGGLFIAVNLAKNKMLNARMFLAFIIIILTVWLLGGIFGLFAMGVVNPKASVSISVGNPAQLLAVYGEEPMESTFSFTCMSPLAETVGCRLAPYTYRPVYIKVCNKDPELPIPPSVLIVTVDGMLLRPNQQISLNQIKQEWGKTVGAGDVFLTAGDKTFWWDEVVAFLKGEKTIVTKGSMYQLFYIVNPIPKGACVEFGKTEDGKDTLFLVAGKGAKINQDHLLQVAMIEITKADKVVNWSEEAIKSAGSWFAKVPLVGGIIGGIAQGLVALVLFLPATIANYFAMVESRTIFVAGAYKFLVAYPYVEIIIVLGVIGVVGLVVTKLMKLW